MPPPSALIARPGEGGTGSASAPRHPAIHSLDSFTLSVPDLDEAGRFFSAFGLTVQREGEGLCLHTGNSRHVWGRLQPGAAKRLLSIALGIYEADVPAFAHAVRDVVLDGAAGGNSTSTSIWCRAPDGLAIELKPAAKTSPDEKPHFGLSPPHCAHRGTGPRSVVPQVKPRRLAHIALFTPDVQAAMDFFIYRLGLRLSDRSGNEVAFLHGAHGSDHHLLALARSQAPGLHHSSWDVATLSEVGQGASQMAAAGYGDGWGMGRHVLGSNYFHYVRDPWGSYAEYSADMDYVGVGVDWPSGDHPGEDSFFQWGPQPPADFVRNYEAAPI